MTYTNPDQIGEVTEITGIAKIIRADGNEEPITLGAEVYIGDIVETEGDGAVNIGFVDDSSFAVSEDARISIDEFVFDPASESGDQDFSVVRGVFMYTSGLIGRENPDSVEIDTPVGSIGIRGTIIGGKIVPDGESQVSVLEGAIVVRNDGGERLLTNQFDTVLLSSRDIAPSEPKTLDVSRVANDYGGVKSVSSSLFSSFDDQMKQEQSPNNADDKKGDVEGKADEAPEDQVEDKEASAEEVVDETVEEAAAEEVKEKIAEELQKDVSTEGETKPQEEVREAIKKSSVERQKERAEAKKEARQEAKENVQDDATETIDTTLFLQDDSLSVINGQNLNENADGSTTGVLVGQVTLSSGASNVTYSLANDAGGQFEINSSTGVVSFIGANSGDYESGDVHNIRVHAVNNDNGQVTAKSYEINVADVDEYSVITGDAMVMSSLTENDEEVGLASDTVIANLTFSEVDGNASHHTLFSTSDARFEVQVNGSQLQLVALSGAQFDYEAETSISVDITQTDGANTYSNHTVNVSIDDLNDESPTNINLSNNNVDENASASTVVGVLSAVDADASGTYTYSITSGNAAGNFSIVGDEIRVAGALDFEDTSSYNLDIEVDDGNGNTYTRNVTIGVDDVNENPEIYGAFQDKFSVTGDIDGVIPFGVDGAVITRLHANDPDGDVFNAGDFSIVGNIFGQAGSNFFEIVDDGSHVVLKLKSGYAIYDDGGNYTISSDGGSSNASGTSSITSDTFNIGVNLNDGGGNTDFENIIVSAGDVEHVTGTVEDILSSSNDIVFGDNADNIMILRDHDFKFIKGGDGHDMIKLSGGLGMQTFDFTSTISNASGKSADLKSIEIFRFLDDHDELKMNIQDLKDLLKTSENGEIIFAKGDLGGNTTGNADQYNGVHFKHTDGSYDSLTDHGFTKESGTVVKDGETFVEYSHASLGSVLIEANIEGASTGGIV